MIPFASSTDYFVARIDPSAQMATYLNSLGQLYMIMISNLYSDVHNMVTFVASLTDTVYYVSKDTLKYAPPVSGFSYCSF